VRINVLAPDVEARYFAACEVMERERLARKRHKETRGLRDLYDLGKLMVQQGCRPEELRALEQSDVDLEPAR
jgi:hypothetical protein